ncbi:MAG: glycosyl hydrolase family 38 [Bacteroidetes bacterium CHB5]|nr:glycosyl hydrolase family 38 [Bacteroidetes bacterium CHB5]
MFEHMNNILHVRFYILFLAELLSFTGFSQERLSDWPVKNANFLQGFELKLQGEVLDFLPQLGPGNIALLTRANKNSQSLQFQTAIIPAVNHDEYLSFVWGAAISRRLQEPAGSFTVYINDEKYFTFYSHKDSLEASWILKQGNAELAFVSTEMTKETQDAFGYMFLNLPAKSFTKGGRLTLKIVNGNQESMDWYMPFSVPVKNELIILAEPALVKVDGVLKQRVRVELNHAAGASKLELTIGNSPKRTTVLKPGRQIFYLHHDPVAVSTTKNLIVRIEGMPDLVEKVTLNPVKKFEVYFLPHSHVDIGFTHTQADVEKLQWRNFEKAISLAEKTKDYPDGAKFKWNAEITWAVEGYLATASPEKKKRFIEAVKKNHIGLDAAYGSQLTGLQREEEMINNQRYALKLNEEYGLGITTAMSSDVPGYSWGTVESMAQSGIRYFSSGPNHMPHLPHGGYQVGYTLDVWGDVPFYWESASGKEKILFWMTSHGYSWFHDWSVDILSKAGGDPILKFLSELESQNYPYDLVQLRYTIGNDNGPPDETMPDFIKNWNETYAFPKLRIATTKEMMEEFEKRYASQIPTYRGDFTPYWEDGAASSALETGLNRKSADRLVQAETLWCMLMPTRDSISAFDSAWRKIVLFSEHTWGAASSKTHPDGELTKSIWKVKQRFALDGDKETTTLLNMALKTISTDEQTIKALQVLNTTSWNRTDLVTLPANWNLADSRITDEAGKPVLTQRLQNGDVAFVARDIPALGSKKYYIKKGNSRKTIPMHTTPYSISNGRIHVGLNSKNGNINLLTYLNGANLINDKDTLGFNAYWYGGIMNLNLKKQGSPSFEITEQGSVLSSIKVTSQAPGAESLTREIQLVNGLDAVYITNVVDKKPILENENVRFAFPFHIPNGQVRIDIPWATVKPETDQLKGANKNFYSVQRWVDVSDDYTGVTMATIEAPILEIGAMNGQNWMADLAVRPWISTYEPSSTLFSWVMNNAWFVNYKASQEGKIPFHYILKPHGPFNDIESKKFGIEQTHPLIVVPVNINTEPIKPILTLSPQSNLIITSLKKSRDGKAIMIRFFNPTYAPGNGTILWGNIKPKQLYKSSFKEEKNGIELSTLTLAPWEVRTIRVEL